MTREETVRRLYSYYAGNSDERVQHALTAVNMDAYYSTLLKHIWKKMSFSQICNTLYCAKSTARRNYNRLIRRVGDILDGKENA